MDIAVVIPCRNEERRLDAAAFAETAAQQARVHFVFVDDGSTDATRSRLQRLVADLPSAELVVLPENRGKAEAVRAGVRAALATPRFEAVGFLDADLATPLSELPGFFGELDVSPVVIGVRKTVTRTGFRRLAAALARGIVRVLYHLPFADTQCGAKFFRSDIAAAVFAEPFVTRWLFDIELLRRIVRLYGSGVVCEREVRSWHDVPGSKIGLCEALRIGLEFIRLKLI